MKTILLLILTIIITSSFSLTAQVSINTDGSDADGSAMLDVKSTEKGFLPPRMSTAQMNTISSPPAGLMIFNTTVNSVCFYDGTSWNNTYNKEGRTCGTITYNDQTYQTVVIGTQCWMAENLNIGTMINSTSGGINGDGEQTNNAIIEKYCYDNNTSNCDTYGGMYQWDEMMQYVTTEGAQGICPIGWHLPTDAEWCILENYVDAGTILCSASGFRGTDVGGKLKESGTTHWNAPNTGATNSSGFTTLPGGYRNSNGLFYWIGNDGYLWSSSESSSTYAWYRNLNYNDGRVYRFYSHKLSGFNVRCIKD